MLRLSDIRQNQTEFILKLRMRNFNATNIFKELLSKDNKRKSIQQKMDGLLQKSNKASKLIGELYKANKADEATKLKEESSLIKNKVKVLQKNLIDIEKDIQNILMQVPNIPHSSVPQGKDERNNKVIQETYKEPELVENAEPHWALAEKYNLISFELGNKITGSGFPVYVDKGARLQRALISFFLNQNINAGYVEYLPPSLVNEESGFSTGQLPDKEGQMYHVNQDNLYLIPTAEVPVTNIFRNTILEEDNLPIKCTAYTPCFRREAGSYGKDVRGLNRLHQFDKVEIVQIQSAEDSYKTLDEMVKHVSSLLEDLKLPYRIVKLCGADLGFTAALTYDFEVYSAAQKKWLEVSSVSNFETYQANRLKLRVKDKEGKINLCHTLNGSALALPRIFAAIIENNQTKEGIIIPKVLEPYTGFDKI